jgi:hypothetical protein
VSRNMAEIDARLLANRIRLIREAVGTDDPDDLAAIVAERSDRIGQLERALEFVLRAPYEGLTEWATTLACARLEHPRIRSDENRTCYCKFTGPGGWSE